MIVQPVKCRHSADGQHQVEQRLSWVGQRMVLLQQIGQRSHLFTRQHIHNSNIPHRVAGKESMRKKTNHSAREKHKTGFYFQMSSLVKSRVKADSELFSFETV